MQEREKYEEQKKLKSETWSSLQSNGRTKQTGGVALTSCNWSNFNIVIILSPTNIKVNRMHEMTVLASAQPFILD